MDLITIQNIYDIGLNMNFAVKARKSALTIARVLTGQDFFAKNGRIKTLENPIEGEKFYPGDYLCLGIEDEFWPISRKKFLETKELATFFVDRWAGYRSTIVVNVFKMDEDFKVITPKSQLLEGEAGSYLAWTETDVWIIKESIFEASYTIES